MKGSLSRSALDGLREIMEMEREAVMEAIRESGGRLSSGQVGRTLERYGRACARLAPFETPRLASVEQKITATAITDPTQTPEEILWDLAKIVDPQFAKRPEYRAIADRAVDVPLDKGSHPERDPAVDIDGD